MTKSGLMLTDLQIHLASLIKFLSIAVWTIQKSTQNNFSLHKINNGLMIGDYEQFSNIHIIDGFGLLCWD